MSLAWGRLSSEVLLGPLRCVIKGWHPAMNGKAKETIPSSAESSLWLRGSGSGQC